MLYAALEAPLFHGAARFFFLLPMRLRAFPFPRA
jgi:hypothetical protein